MRVLVAGASGAIGRPLVAALIGRGHDVAALTRDPNKADVLSRLGAQPLIADVLDRDSSFAAVRGHRAGGRRRSAHRVASSVHPRDDARGSGARPSRLRTIGGDNLYAAAAAAGARRYVAQSGCYYYRPGDGLAGESEPWVEDGPPLVAGGVRALLAVEHRALHSNGSLTGTALRYGFFYGPGTWFHPDGDVAVQVRAGSVSRARIWRRSLVVRAYRRRRRRDRRRGRSATSPAPSTSATTTRCPCAGGCPSSPGTSGRRGRRMCRSDPTRIRTAGSTPSCFEVPTITSLAESSVSIPDHCHGVEMRCGQARR